MKNNLTEAELNEWMFRYCCLSLLYRYYALIGEQVQPSIKAHYEKQNIIPLEGFVNDDRVFYNGLEKLDKALPSLVSLVEKLENLNSVFKNNAKYLDYASLKIQVIGESFDYSNGNLERKRENVDLDKLKEQINESFKKYKKRVDLTPGRSTNFVPLKFELYKAISKLDPEHYDKFYSFFDHKIEEKFVTEIFDEKFFYEVPITIPQRDASKRTDWKSQLKRRLPPALIKSAKSDIHNPFPSPFEDEFNLDMRISENDIFWTPFEFEFYGKDHQTMKVGDVLFQETYEVHLKKIYLKILNQSVG